MTTLQMLQKDLEEVYSLADLKASLNGAEVRLFIENDYEVENIKQKVFRGLASELQNITNSDVLVVDGISYKVISITPTSDELELILWVERI